MRLTNDERDENEGLIDELCYTDHDRIASSPVLLDRVLTRMRCSENVSFKRVSKGLSFKMFSRGRRSLPTTTHPRISSVASVRTPA